MIINGTGDGLFSPDQDITRAEFAAIIVRGLGLKFEEGVTPFSDVKKTDWYSSVIHTAYKHQLINGFEDGTFRPDDKITREQAMVHHCPSDGHDRIARNECWPKCGKCSACIL